MFTIIKQKFTHTFTTPQLNREINTHINPHKHTHTPNSKYSRIPMFTAYPHECQCDDPQPPPSPPISSLSSIAKPKDTAHGVPRGRWGRSLFRRSDLFVHTNFFPQISYRIWWLWSEMNFWILWTLSTKGMFLARQGHPISVIFVCCQQK